MGRSRRRWGCCSLGLDYRLRRALLLTFMTGGRLEVRVDRALVGVFTLALVVAQFVWMLFLEFDGHLLLVFGDAQIAEAIDEGRRWLTALASVAVAVVLAARWRAASRPRRRALLPGVVGIVSALLYTALLVDGLVAAPPSETLWWLANSALLLVPAAPPRGVSGATGGAAGIARAARRRRRRGAPPARSVTIGYDGLSTAAMLVGSLSGTAIRGAGENARLR
jgi:hypothetical protein